MGSFFPKVVKSGDCQEVIRTEGFSLFDLPILAGVLAGGWRLATSLGPWSLPKILKPASGTRAATACRFLTSAPPECTGRLRSYGAEHFCSARAKNRAGKIDVAVATGADPGNLSPAGILPVPPDMDEFMFSGFLRRDPVELVKCKTVDLEVPANAEIVLEGHVDLAELRTEGPLRRSHRILFPRRPASRLSRELLDPPEGSSLSHHHRGSASARGLLHRPRHRTRLFAGDENATSGNRRRGHACRRNLSEFDDCCYSQELPRARAENDECDLVAGAGHVYQSDPCRRS